MANPPEQPPPQPQEPQWQGQQTYPQQYPPPGYGQQYPPPPGYGQQYPPAGYGPPPRPPKARKSGCAIAAAILGGLAALVILIVVIVAVVMSGIPSGNGSGSGSGSGGAGPVNPPPAPRQVEFIVKGSAADVTYGATGSDHQGRVPMDKKIRLGNPQYYSISAQLNGSGKVTCWILIGGQVISKATATGSYNIASCEISRNILSGKWEDTNQG